MFTIGTRGSALALAQTTWVKDHILSRFPDTQLTVKVIKTSADKDTASSIRSGKGIGVFVKEIEEALLRGEIDLAVHSLKDLPTRIPETLAIGAIPEREDPRDALITGADAAGLSELPKGAVVGTGSLRRQAQILALRGDLRVIDIRGNVDTRLQKLATGAYDAIILACAGLKRLGLDGKITARLGIEQMLPAPGQGALALEIRRDDPAALPLIAALHHASSAVAVCAERAFLQRMGGGCNIPVAAHAAIEGGKITIRGLVGALDGSRIIRDSIIGESSGAEEAAAILAERILGRGGTDLLAALR
jgi:hydroxymethylbilane synthase